MTRKMKDSGVDWIGEIPKDWKVQNLKSILEERNEMNNPIKTESILSLTNDRGVIPYSEKGDIGNKSKEDLSKYKLAYPNDIVVNSMNVIIGSVGLSDYFGATSPVYYMLYVRDNKDSIHYYNYLFQTKEFQSKLVGYGNGIMEHRMRIPMLNLNKVHLPYPKSFEQKSIADFLDEKTQEIDNIISKTKKAIEEYKRYKQSLITETVTKGLDKNVQMKDSEIEWIGKIPENWDVSKIKYFYNITLGKMLQPRQRNNDETKEYYISAINIQDDVDLSIEKQMWFSKNEKSMYKIEKGDLLTVEGGHAGKSILWEYSNLDKEYYFQNSILRARNKFNSDNRFLKYWMQSLRGVGYLDYICNKATIVHFTREKYLNTEIVVLDYKEQEQIASYLDKKCSQIDQIISTKEKFLREMEAYKKSLIYETVTGKREVE